MAIVIDALGRQCPLPVVMTRKVLLELEGPETVEVLVDNEVAVQNLSRLAQHCGVPVRAEKLEEDRFRVTLTAAGPVVQEETEPVCAPERRGRTVAAIGSDRMGDGAEALGRVLMKGFLYALSQLPELPQTVLFYNSGARLTCAGSDSLEDLRFLEAQGVEILTCGTCLDFYGLKETLAVGGITNMYDIVERLAGADRVLRP